MGVITGLLNLPLAPVRGVTWLAEQVQTQAEREWYDQVENVGQGLMRLAEAMQTLRDQFGIGAEELNLDLGPLGPLLPRD